MTLAVEPFGYTDDEYRHMAAIESAIFKMPAYAVEDYRHEDESRRTEPEWFENGVTGVRRDYRRRGIATAVKVHLLRYAQARGARAIATGNDAQNPMYRLNLKLGFKPEPAWVRTEKPL